MKFAYDIENIVAYKAENDVPEKACGVYFLCDGGIPIYIGVSIDVRNRVGCHRRKGIPFNCIFHLPVKLGDYSSRLPLRMAEQKYLMMFDPAYNFYGTKKIHQYLK